MDGNVGSLLAVLGIYLLINILLIGVGIGVGFVLHWMLPAIELGAATLIGVISTALSVHFFGRPMALLEAYGDEDVGPGPKPVLTISPVRSISSRRRRKRGSS